LFRAAAAAGDSQGMFNCGAIEYISHHAAQDPSSLEDVFRSLRVPRPCPSSQPSHLTTPHPRYLKAFSPDVISPQGAAELGHAAARSFLAAFSKAPQPSTSWSPGVLEDESSCVFVVTGGWHR
jgi:hypothetical protein